MKGVRQKEAQRFSFFDFFDRFPIDLNIDLIIP